MKECTKEQLTIAHRYKEVIYTMTGQNSFVRAINDAAMRARDNFGIAQQLYMSPKVLNQFHGLLAHLKNNDKNK